MLSRVFCALYLCFLYGIVCDNNEAFQFLDRTADPCAESCEKDPLAYKGFERKSCVRGCHLFAICEWNVNNLTEACSECKLACKEAYQNNNVSKDACNDGCNSALPLAEQRHKKFAEQAEVAQSRLDVSPSLFDGKNPFGMMLDENEKDSSIFGLDSLMNDMMEQAMKSFGKFNHFMSSSSRYTEIFDIKDENGEYIIIVEHAGPQINTPHPDDKKIVLNTGSAGFKSTLKGHLESNLQTNVNSEWSSNDAFLDDDDYVQPCCCSWSKFKSRWWSCVQQGNCLAELALIVFWISVTFVLLVTCCLPQRLRKKELSVNGDLAFITDSKGSLPSYAKPYPAPEDAKKSPYYLASVVSVSDEKVPLP